jgi:hypothetical protein
MKWDKCWPLPRDGFSKDGNKPLKVKITDLSIYLNCIQKWGNYRLFPETIPFPFLNIPILIVATAVIPTPDSDLIMPVYRALIARFQCYQIFLIDNFQIWPRDEF